MGVREVEPSGFNWKSERALMNGSLEMLKSQPKLVTEVSTSNAIKTVPSESMAWLLRRKGPSSKSLKRTPLQSMDLKVLLVRGRRRSGDRKSTRLNSSH